MKFALAALVLLLTLLQYRLWLGEGGMRELDRLQTQIGEQRQENERLRERNRTLAAEVQDLKKGTTAIEERARTDLGMVGAGETFFQVATPRSAPGEATAGEPDAGRTASGAPLADQAEQPD